jgi:hypothetical protein
MGSDINDTVLEFIKANGPILPSELGKHLQREILISSAILSDLVARKVICISKAKIGGSPVYYLRGQEDRLERLYSHLNEKDRGTYDMIKEQMVMEDSLQDPLTRVSLRTIKDFAFPFIFEERQFWRWHLLPESEAFSIAKGEKKPAPIAQPKRETKPEEKPAAPIFSAKVEKHEPSVASSIETAIKTNARLSPVYVKPKKTRQAKLRAPESKEAEEQKKQPAKKPEDEFFSQAEQFFSKSGIEITERIEAARKSEYDFIVRIPSNVGALDYFCRARKKASVNEDDLSSAYVQAQIRKLPCLFITTGKMTRRASEMLARDFRNMAVRNI